MSTEAQINQISYDSNILMIEFTEMENLAIDVLPKKGRRNTKLSIVKQQQNANSQQINLQESHEKIMIDLTETHFNKNKICSNKIKPEDVQIVEQIHLQIPVLTQPSLELLHQNASGFERCLKYQFKCILFPIYFVILALSFLILCVFIAAFFVICLTFGILVTSTMYIWKQYSSPIKFLVLLLHPFFWPIGVYYSLKKIFLFRIRNLMGYFCHLATVSLEKIGNF